MAASFFASYCAGDQAAGELLAGRPADADAWVAAARAAARRRAPPALVAELHRQSAALPPSPARERHLDALEAGGCAVVVTGQQVGLFLGPLYTLHKAATAVARARLVAERTGRPCVPLFWLQTEDHDWAEIASAELLSGAGRTTLALPAEEPDEARVSLAQRQLPAQTAGLVERLRELLAPLHHGAAVADLVARHYAPGRAPGAAFAGVLAELFTEEGLVLLDPRTPAVAALARPLLASALERHDEIAGALAERGAGLERRGFAEQVRTRPEASLVFFHPRGPAGPRHRLRREPHGFSTPEGPIGLDALRDRLERDPLWFSTSALLRPLLQDSLLPTCAYLGGPAECTYFAQLPPLYALLGVERPLIAPRARLRVVDEPARGLLEKLGLAAEDVDQPREALLARVAARPAGVPDGAALRERLLGPFSRELEALEAAAPALDPGLADPVRRTRETVAHAVGRLVERVEKAALGRDKVGVERLDRLLLMLRPDGEPQERVWAFPPLAARLGPRAFIEALVAAAAPLSSEVRSVRP